MFDIDWVGLSVPFGYIMVLGSMMYVFSTIYRKRKAAESANLAPWFPPHLQKNIYSSLLELDAQAKEEKKTKVPDSVIRAALLRRAVEDISRIIQVRTSKQALNVLLQKGSVGEDLNQRHTRAEQEMEAEIRDVVMEANALAPGWGQVIFQSANEIAANSMLRSKLEAIQDKQASEKEWWERKRETIQKDFMKELDEDAAKSKAKVASDDEGVLIESNTAPSTPSSSKKKKGKK